MQWIGGEGLIGGLAMVQVSNGRSVSAQGADIPPCYPEKLAQKERCRYLLNG